MWHAHLARDLRAGRPCHVAKIHQNLMAVIECWIKSLSASSAKTSDSSLRLISPGIRNRWNGSAVTCHHLGRSEYRLQATIRPANAELQTDFSPPFDGIDFQIAESKA